MAAVKYLQVLNEKQFEKSLAKFNRTVKSFEEDVDTILNWIQQQPHLPKETLERNIIACILFESKCSVEKSKDKVDWLFTVHSVLPEFFKNNQPWGPKNVQAQKYLSLVLVPKLTEKNERVSIFKYNRVDDESKFNIDAAIANMFNILTLSLLEERMEGRVWIVDTAEIKFSYVRQVTPPLMKKTMNALEKAFSLKFNAAHFVNVPPYFSPIISLIKQFLKPKLKERIFIHDNTESLKKVISKEYLPSDYEGDLPSMQELQRMQNELLETHKEFFEKREKWTVDESRRPQKLDTNDLFGIQGNFKKLDVD